MKVTAFIGSARKKFTYRACERVLQNLTGFADVEYELVPLCDYRLEMCCGCKVCFEKGEEFCPFQDDRDKLLQKME